LGVGIVVRKLIVVVSRNVYELKPHSLLPTPYIFKCCFSFVYITFGTIGFEI